MAENLDLKKIIIKTLDSNKALDIVSIDISTTDLPGILYMNIGKSTESFIALKCSYIPS